MATRPITSLRKGAAGERQSAAVVDRQFGTPAVVGCEAIEIDLDTRQMEVNGRVVKEGDWISLDGSEGEVIIGQIPTYPSEIHRAVIECTLDPKDSAICQAFGKLLTWADEVRRLGISVVMSSGLTAVLSVVYLADGNYTATFTATDTNGNSCSDSRNVEVGSAPPPPPRARRESEPPARPRNRPGTPASSVEPRIRTPS